MEQQLQLHLQSYAREVAELSLLTHALHALVLSARALVAASEPRPVEDDMTVTVALQYVVGSSVVTGTLPQLRGEDASTLALSDLERARWNAAMLFCRSIALESTATMSAFQQTRARMGGDRRIARESVAGTWRRLLLLLPLLIPELVTMSFNSNSGAALLTVVCTAPAPAAAPDGSDNDVSDNARWRLNDAALTHAEARGQELLVQRIQLLQQALAANLSDDRE